MELLLGKCKVRNWQMGDKSSLLLHANNWNVSKYLRDLFPYPYTEKDADTWLKLTTLDSKPTKFAIVVNDSAVGGIGLEIQSDIHRRSAEIGYWLGESYWGKGIMTEAVRGITDYAFEHFDLCRIYGGVFETNRASARVLEKAGYMFEGCLRKSVTKGGRTLDQLLYSIIQD
ncbi:MAG: GNAT family N-acetyltransferase [Bacillota bacterium]